jgi:hypothetical protein
MIAMVAPRSRGVSPEDRFFDFFIPEPNSGCWLWMGQISNSGYGRFSVGNRIQVQAHRFSWELHNGKIPEGLFACHKCDVRCCVNPEHLFIGTQSDNLNDMVQKGRDNPARGERSARARLTEAQAQAIRLDPRRLRIIAEEYGIHKSWIWAIKHGEGWKHSHADNPEEAERSDRHRAFKGLRGEAHLSAKLTAEQVLSIRNDQRGCNKLAAEYGVSRSSIKRIRNGKCWGYI